MATLIGGFGFKKGVGINGKQFILKKDNRSIQFKKGLVLICHSHSLFPNIFPNQFEATSPGHSSIFQFFDFEMSFRWLLCQPIDVGQLCIRPEKISGEGYRFHF
jgi:hypothetical protein